MAEVIEVGIRFLYGFYNSHTFFFFYIYIFFICLDIVCKMVEVIGMESGFQTIFITAIFIFSLSFLFFVYVFGYYFRTLAVILASDFLFVNSQ